MNGLFDQQNGEVDMNIFDEWTEVSDGIYRSKEYENSVYELLILNWKKIDRYFERELCFIFQKH